MNATISDQSGQGTPRYQTIDTEAPNSSASIQVGDLSQPFAPEARRLSRCAEVRHGTLYAARVTGAAMFSTGLTANICRHMMNNPNPKESEGMLIGLGILAFLTGAVGQASTITAQRRDSIKQSLKDAVVPAIVSFSVYLALSHGAI
jgi:hypothetical protein